jgi:TPR repeat protein
MRQIIFATLLFTFFQAHASVDIALDYLADNKPEQAEKVLKELAVAGNSEAQYLLGKLYLDRKDGEKMMDQGVYWLNVAVKNRHQMSAETLSRMYMSGLGVPFDPEKGAEYLLLANDFRDPFELAPECD